MSPAWRRWPTGDAAALIEYVQRKRQGESTPGTPADLLGPDLPAPGDPPPADRVRALYEAFAARDIVYADEPPTSDPGRQTVRPPYEVLASPRHGTCLDLAVTFAGACLDAGLHPLILVTAGTGGGPAHALVAVWLDGTWSNRADRDYRADEDDADWRALPEDFLDDVAEDADAPGRFLVLDVTGVSSRSDAADPRRRERQTFAASVAHGAELTRRAAAEGRLRVCLDVGLGHPECEPLPLPDQPTTRVLAPPYLPSDDGDAGPLRPLWARHDIVRFHPRDELDFLQDWCLAPDPQGPRTRIALVHGVGGAGKTRLAAELAARLAGRGWYTGFLVRDPDLRDCAWLARIASPLLVVVDYAEDHKSADITNVLRTLRDRTDPTCLVLTARSVGGWWEDEIADALAREGHRFAVQPVPLAPRHPRETGVYRFALRSFGAREERAMGSNPPPDPRSGRWTTLDLVMHAWLDAQTAGGDRPTSESALYEKILTHELDYWVRSYTARIGRPSRRTREMLREAGAAVSLLAPRGDRLDAVLSSVPELTHDGRWRSEITALVEELLPTAPEDGTIAVRPDPVGSHLASSVFRADQTLFQRCLEAADPDERLNVCVGVSRLSAGGGDGDGGTGGLAHQALAAVPELWPQALTVAAAQGGPFVGALERLAAEEDTPMPLAELSVTLPMRHSTLRGLALVATLGSRPAVVAEAPTEENLSALGTWMNNLSIRQGETGDRIGALETITQAVAIRRTLTQGPNGPAHLPDLAMSLNNFSIQQAETGDRQGALHTITEAVTIRRTLSEGSDAAALPTRPRHVPQHPRQPAGRHRRPTGRTAHHHRSRRPLPHPHPRTERTHLPPPPRQLPQQPRQPAGRYRRPTGCATHCHPSRSHPTQPRPRPQRDRFSPRPRRFPQQPRGPAGRDRRPTRCAAHHHRSRQPLPHPRPRTQRSRLPPPLRRLPQQPRYPSSRDRRPAGRTRNHHRSRHPLPHPHPRTQRRRSPAPPRRFPQQPLHPAGRDRRPDRRTQNRHRSRHPLPHPHPRTQRRRSPPLPRHSLNNLANRQAETGDQPGALHTITEAVTTTAPSPKDPTPPPTSPTSQAPSTTSPTSRPTPETGSARSKPSPKPSPSDAPSPMAQRTRLPPRPRQVPQQPLQPAGRHRRPAGRARNHHRSRHHPTRPHQGQPRRLPPRPRQSLNNLSNQQADTGDRRRAETITEAVSHPPHPQPRPTAPPTSPTSPCPSTTSPTSRADTGDRIGALKPSPKPSPSDAPSAKANPAAYLPDLAVSLNNLSNRQADTGDRRPRSKPSPKPSPSDAPSLRSQRRRLPPRPRRIPQQPRRPASRH